jgi:hypothetical protein
MVAKRSSTPLTTAPAGTKFAGSKIGTNFAAPMKGSHSGAMGMSKKSTPIKHCEPVMHSK